jgi:hypothetical protein
MRGTIAIIFLWAGIVGSVIAAACFAYWIWQFDWGVSTRGRGLMFIAMVFGSIITFFAGYFASFYASAAIAGD